MYDCVIVCAAIYGYYTRVHPKRPAADIKHYFIICFKCHRSGRDGRYEYKNAVFVHPLLPVGYSSTHPAALDRVLLVRRDARLSKLRPKRERERER